MSVSRSRFKVPHVFVLLTGVILVSSIFTWIIPSGSYKRQTKVIDGHERTLLVPGDERGMGGGIAGSYCPLRCPYLSCTDPHLTDDPWRRHEQIRQHI